MVKNLLETFLKPNLSMNTENGYFASIVKSNLSFLAKMTDFDENWRREGHEKRLLDYFYDMNLVRNVQKCSKMRSLKLKRKRGDWKSLKKVRKKVSSGAGSSLIFLFLFSGFSLVEHSSAAHVITVNRLPLVGIQTV